MHCYNNFFHYTYMFFYYMYFTSDYSKEIHAKNTTEHTENYNYTEYKENIERKVNKNVGMD